MKTSSKSYFIMLIGLSFIYFGCDIAEPPACVPNQVKCELSENGIGIQYSCNISNIWVENSCVEGGCDGKFCEKFEYPSCSDKDNKCIDISRESVTQPNGAQESMGLMMTCVDGKLVPKICEGGLLCDSNVCQTQICTPGDKFCFQNELFTLSVSCIGTSWVTSYCKYGSACLNGTCLDPPELKYHYSDTPNAALPLVLQLTDDNSDTLIDENDTPDILYVAEYQRLVALNGNDGSLIINGTTGHSYSPTGIAAADLDNDGKMEIVIGTRDPTSVSMQILRLEKPGSTYQWTIVDNYIIPDLTNKNCNSNDQKFLFADMAAAIADLDGNGKPEIVTAMGVFALNNEQKIEKRCDIPIRYGDTCQWYPIRPIVADLNKDGKGEIISGNYIYDMDCQQLYKPAEDTTVFYHAAVAKLTSDEAQSGVLEPQLILTGNSIVTANKIIVKSATEWDLQPIWTHQTNYPITTCDPSNNMCSLKDNYLNGSPLVADFNADTIPDVGVSGTYGYTALDGKTGDRLWRYPIWDISGHTSSTALDLYGTGHPAIAYRDETYLYLLDSANGSEIIPPIDTRSSTRIEYPIIADVTGDGIADLLVLSQDDNDESKRGVFVYSAENWSKTRSIWNQYTYHITNILENGKVPAKEDYSWQKFNTYQTNVIEEQRNVPPGFLTIPAVLSFISKS